MVKALVCFSHVQCVEDTHKSMLCLSVSCLRWFAVSERKCPAANTNNASVSFSLCFCCCLVLPFGVWSMRSTVNSPSVAAFIASPLSLIITLETGERLDRYGPFYCYIVSGATAVDSSPLCLQQRDTHRSASKPDQAVFHRFCSGQHIIILFGCQPHHMFVMLSGCFISTVASGAFSSTAERIVIEYSHCTKRVIRCRNKNIRTVFFVMHTLAWGTEKTTWY